MKQLFICTVIIWLLGSCTKNGDDSSSMQAALMAHTWVLDSTTFRNTDLQPVIYREPKDRTRFGTDKYYTSSGSGPITDSTYYEVEKSDKLYIWGIERKRPGPLLSD